MTCTNCKNEVPDTSQFCPGCGTPVASVQGAPVSTQNVQAAVMAPLQKILTSKYLSGTRNRIIAAAVVVLVIVGAVVLAGGSSKSPEQSCELNLSNWVISTSNFMQSNPNSIPPLMNQFGTSSPITQWVDGQLGSFLSGSVQNGQASADGQLETAAVQECQSLASSGTNIGAIPAP